MTDFETKIYQLVKEKFEEFIEKRMYPLFNEAKKDGTQARYEVSALRKEMNKRFEITYKKIDDFFERLDGHTSEEMEESKKSRESIEKLTSMLEAHIEQYETDKPYIKELRKKSVAKEVIKDWITDKKFIIGFIMSVAGIVFLVYEIIEKF